MTAEAVIFSCKRMVLFGFDGDADVICGNFRPIGGGRSGLRGVLYKVGSVDLCRGEEDENADREQAGDGDGRQVDGAGGAHDDAGEKGAEKGRALAEDVEDAKRQPD